MPFDPSTATLEKPKKFDPSSATLATNDEMIGGQFRPTGPLPGEQGHVDPVAQSPIDKAIGSQIPSYDPKHPIKSVAGALGSGAMGVLESQMGAGAVPAAAKVGSPVVKTLGMGAGKGGELAGKGLAGAIGGLGTRTGGLSIEEAAKAGYTGGEEGKAFWDNLFDKGKMPEVISAAKQGLANMRQARNLEYRSGMADVSKDATVLKFDGVDKALSDIPSYYSFKGQVTNANAAKVAKSINDTVTEWKSLDPKEFHTPEGLDALKKSIGALREQTEAGTQSRAIVDKTYDAIKSTITKQAPGYSKVMKDYEEASDQLYELEKSLSLGEKGSADTALRKLQSIMRNNVNSNYGNRLQSVKTIEDEGGVSLRPSLAGQALSSWMPRGLGGRESFAAGPVAAAYTHNPALALLAPLQSPKLMGMTAYGAGKAARGLTDTLKKIGLAPQDAEDIAQSIGKK